ncbi:MAG: hypothetical protein LDL41_23020 [Coleofasciculus sp. S288]|nr:hypothetical protein [Coleofasciculus sp. S288]
MFKLDKYLFNGHLSIKELFVSFKELISSDRSKNWLGRLRRLWGSSSCFWRVVTIPVSDRHR